MPKDYPLHISDMRCFKQCRQLWHFTSPLRMNLAPNWPNRHLWGGTGMHVALAAYYEPSDPFNPDRALNVFNEWLIRSWMRLETLSLSPERWEEIFQMAYLINRMLLHYFQWAPKEDRFTVLASEVPFRFPIPMFPGKHVYYEGRADGLVRWKDGTYWLLEHKTAGRFPSYGLLFIDEQCVAYQWAAQVDPRFEGQRPIGTVYTFLLKELPTIPRMLKRGGLSQAKNMHTTYEVYKAELDRLGLPTTLYGSTLQRLRTRGNTFFSRVRIKRQPQAMQIFGQRLMGTIAEMLDPQVHIAPSPNWWSCQNCAFRIPCTMLANGVDPGPSLRANYRKRLPRPMPAMQKQCRYCGAWKPLTDFAKDKRSKDGYQSWCKECKRARYRAVRRHEWRQRWETDP